MGKLAAPLARVILGGIAWIYFLSPYLLRKLAARSLGSVLRVARLRSNVIRQNLALAYPGDRPEQSVRRHQLYREAYWHLGELAFEILLLFGPMRSMILRRVVFKGFEHLKKAQEQGKGALILCTHVGNWEVAAATFGVAGGGALIVTKILKPGWLHAAIESGRRSCGVDAAYEPKTLQKVIQRLKENRPVGFVLDQYVGPPVGVRVPFFGVPVGTAMTVAAFARRWGTPVLPLSVHRMKDGRFTVELRPPLEWQEDPDPQRELAVNTARYSEVVEAEIKAYPGQWLWTHRRFKGDLSPLRPGEWEQGRARS